MTDLVPIINLPYLEANGCQVSRASTTTIAVAAGQLRDSTNTFDMVITTPLLISTAVTGANGLDTGTVADSTGYYVFALTDPTNNNNPAGLLSLSATAPVMPSVDGVTYGAFRCIGFVVTDGSANLLAGIWNGNESQRFWQYDAPVLVLNGGNSTSAADVSLAHVVPATFYGKVQVKATYTPGSAADTASVKAKVASSYQQVIQGIVGGVAQPYAFEILPSLNSGAATLTYILNDSDGALSLYVTGFEMNL